MKYTEKQLVGRTIIAILVILAMLAYGVHIAYNMMENWDTRNVQNLEERKDVSEAMDVEVITTGIDDEEAPIIEESPSIENLDQIDLEIVDPSTL